MRNLKTFAQFINESNEIGGYYLMSTLLDLADDSKRIRDMKMHDAYMWLHDRIDQSYRDIDLSRDDIRDLLKEPQGRKHAKNLPDWAIEDLFSESLNEDSKVEDRIKELAKDPKNQSAMGSSNVADLEHAFMVLFKRGYGAAQTNWGAVHPTIKKLGRGEAAYNAWGHARLNAFIDKRKAYLTSDSDVAKWLKGEGPKPEPK